MRITRSKDGEPNRQLVLHVWNFASGPSLLCTSTSFQHLLVCIPSRVCRLVFLHLVMAKAAYELVVGLEKGKKVVKNERKPRPASTKGVSV